MKRLLLICLLLSVALAGCGGDKDKGTKKGLDIPVPADEAPPPKNK
jgi:hypothetical protein